MMKNRQAGFLLMVIALLLVVIASFAISFVSMLQSGANSSISFVAANAAYDLAMSGIEAGNYQMLVGGL